MARQNTTVDAVNMQKMLNLAMKRLLSREKTKQQDLLKQ
jgi:hypothetical protein